MQRMSKSTAFKRALELVYKKQKIQSKPYQTMSATGYKTKEEIRELFNYYSAINLIELYEDIIAFALLQKKSQKARKATQEFEIKFGHIMVKAKEYYFRNPKNKEIFDLLFCKSMW